MIGRRTFLGRCAATLTVGAIGDTTVARLLFAAEPAKKVVNKPLELAVFEKLLEKHKDKTYEQMYTDVYKDRKYLDKLSFDPTKAAYYDRIAEKLQMTDEEKGIFAKNGFVSIDHKRRHSFASAYWQIYSVDLPVFVSTDSIMHALHRSYDDILMQLEMTLFTYTITQVLEDCHAALAERAAKSNEAAVAANYQDVDLYLTVARNLLAGAGAQEKDNDNPTGNDPKWHDFWKGDVRVASKRDNDKEALARLKDVQELKIKTPDNSEPLAIYGGERYIDWSQFKPRGHYTKNTTLKRYFRTLMWLGRIDCGWNVLDTGATPGVKSDSDRELRNSVLMIELLTATDSLKRLKAMDDIINFMVGKSDNLTVWALQDLMKDAKTETLSASANADALKRLKTAIESGKHAQQMIRSQLVVSNPNDTYKVPPPSSFQLFGQRFIIDSFVLSQVVFDSIIFKGAKQERMMPAGLDVMAALGNQEAIPLLSDELKKWNYSANLLASRDFVDLHKDEFWKANLYNLWLDCLRTLDDDLSANKNFPEVMKTKAWQMKQLQTQLGSWAELRHDTILYAKQSYTAFPSCEYPAGYVEPYPEFYARVKFFAEEAGRLFKDADYSSPDKNRAAELKFIKDRQEVFFKKMAETVGSLHTLAKKELNAEKFTAEEQTFLKKTIDIRGGGSGPPTYSGWYCDLFYNRLECTKWDPTVADVHTDPKSQSCLEVGVGDVNFGVIAIDNEKDRAVYVGPLFSYYEFRHPVNDRLTDQQWQDMIQKNKLPARPEWVNAFQATPAERKPQSPR
ncbi:MAG: DUF3160 domain-containing protein [Gemmataceae bacterium]|nr:DUF3160 domain-containing protein [Gemmataceae bacterium]